MKTLLAQLYQCQDSPYVIALVRNTLLVFIAGFLLLFCLKLAHDYWDRPDGAVIRSGNSISYSGSGLFSFGTDVKNYASRKLAATGGGGLAVAGAASAVNQKYEKVANVALRSRAFDDDEKKVRQLIEDNTALIQYERREGLKGKRVLRLTVGVGPDAFDGFVDKVQTFGKLTQLTINKTDKTNEYRELKAKRVSLEKARAALEDLKKRDGEVRAMIELEKQILDLEQQIQSLGVSLGDFDSENEFVTVKLLLAEAGKAVLRSLSTARRMFDALAWTLPVYALFWLGIAAALFAAFVAAHLGRLAMAVAKQSEEHGGASAA